MTSPTDSPLYRRAFEHYLRKGIRPEIYLKAMNHQTTAYIWRTKEDDKVRLSHAANNGKIFS